MWVVTGSLLVFAFSCQFSADSCFFFSLLAWFVFGWSFAFFSHQQCPPLPCLPLPILATWSVLRCGFISESFLMIAFSTWLLASFLHHRAQYPLEAAIVWIGRNSLPTSQNLSHLEPSCYPSLALHVAQSIASVSSPTGFWHCSLSSGAISQIWIRFDFSAVCGSGSAAFCRFLLGSICDLLLPLSSSFEWCNLIFNFPLPAIALGIPILSSIRLFNH